MTKLRDPLTVEDGITQALAVLGPAGAAQVTGKSAELVRKWGDPDCDGHHIPLYQAIALDAACAAAGGGTPLLTAYQAVLRRRLQELAAAGGDPLLRIAEVMESVGDVAGSVRRARAPDSDGGAVYTAAEKRDTLHRLAQARADLDRLERDILAADVPAAAPDGVVSLARGTRR